MIDRKHLSCQIWGVIIYWKDDKSRQDNNGKGCVEPGIFFGLLYSRGGGRGRGCGGVGVHTGAAFHSDGADGLF